MRLFSSVVTKLKKIETHFVRTRHIMINYLALKIFLFDLSGAADAVDCEGGDHLFTECADVHPGRCQPGRVSVEQEQDDH